mgnify:FL=1
MNRLIHVRLEHSYAMQYFIVSAEDVSDALSHVDLWLDTVDDDITNWNIVAITNLGPSDYPRGHIVVEGGFAE